MKKVLAVFIFCSNAFALDITPGGLYRATKEACSKVTEADLHNLNFDKLKVGYFPSREFTEVQTFIRSESTKAAALEMNVTGELSITRYILADQGFQKALTECYPNSPKMREFFVSSIHHSDRAGKFVGIAAMLVAFKGTGRLFSFLKGWSGTAYRYLQMAGRGLESLMLASLFTSDSTKEEKPIQWRISEEDLKKETQKLSEMEASIRRQIQAEEDKIKSCGECPEKIQLEKNKSALQIILNLATDVQ